MPTLNDHRSRFVIVALCWGLLVLVAGAWPSAANARPGDRDLTFGDGGEVTTPFAYPTDVVAIDAQGRFVVGGHILDGDHSPPSYLTRYDTNGRLDPTFGFEGRVAIGPSFRSVDLAGLAVRSDGRLLLIGRVDILEGTNGYNGIVVTRLAADGAVDTTFADAGKILIRADLTFSFRPPNLLVHDDGALTVASLACTGGVGCALATFRFDADGTPLGSVFTRDGMQDVEDGVVHLARDGHLLLTARVYDAPDFLLAFVRFDGAGGFVDRTVTKRRLSSSDAPASTLTDDGRSIAVGTTDDQLDVRRYLPDGRPDLTWTPTLITPPESSEARAFAVTTQPDGRVLLAGAFARSFQSFDRFVAMLRPDGGLDAGFGDDGVVRRGAPAHDGAVLVQPDGRIVAVGADGTHVVLTRYAGSTRACGDADGDTTLTVTDGVRVLRAAAELPSSCLAFCDTDASGAVDVTDAVRVLRAAAAIPVDLECVPTP